MKVKHSQGYRTPFFAPSRSPGAGLVVAACVLGVAVLPLPSVAADEDYSPAPVAVCGEAAEAPVVDGRLDDPAWREATCLGPFVQIASHEEAAQRTTCRVTHDGEWLYLGLEAFEQQMGRLVTDADRRDHPRAWADDCVQVFIAPGDPWTAYYHIILTAGNVVFDERVVDGHRREPAWNAQVRSAVHRGRDRWTAELAIRLRDLGLDPAALESVAFNVSRAAQPGAEWTSWAPLNANMHEFQHFGRLVFSAEPIIKSLDLPSPFVGRNEFRLSMGAASEPYVAELQVLKRDQVHTKTGFAIAPHSSASLGYTIYEEGPGRVRLIVRPEGRPDVLYASAPMRFDVPRVRSEARDMAERLGSAAAVARAARDDGVARRLESAITRLQSDAERIARDADRMAASGRVRPDRWSELHQRVRDLAPRARINELKGHLAGMGVTPMPAFALGTESSLRKLAPDDSEYGISRVLSLQAARRERESGQVVVASLGEAVKGVRVEWTGLRGPGQARIPHDRIAVSLVGYVTTRNPVYPVERVGRWPDPLLPLEAFDVPEGEIQPLWVTVDVPPGAPPGEYRGEISVSTADDPPQTVQVALEVWDIELPLHGTFRTGFGVVPGGDVAVWYGFGDDLPDDFRRKWHEVLLSNRVNPAGLYVQEMWPPPEDLEWCRRRGLNAVCVGNVGVGDPRRLQEVSRTANWLRERDLLDTAYVYGVTPVDWQELEHAQEALSAVRRLVPGLRRVSPTQPIRPLWGYANIWATLTADYDHLYAQSRRRLGEETWWYVGCGPRHPYANFFIDYPATDARALFWAAFKYRITGFFYYETAMWASNMLTQDIGDPSIVIHEDPEVLEAMRQGTRWPQVPWNTYTFSRYNGDGQLIYPGPNETPLPSLRLEIIRDGIEDYELLELLRDAADRLRTRDPERTYGFLVDESMRLAEVDPRVVVDLTNFTDDPQEIATQRERVARQLMRVERTLEEMGGTPQG